MEDFMKKTILMILFVIFFVCVIYSQTRPENSWLIGTWVADKYNWTFVLNNDGSGTFTSVNPEKFHFSVNQNFDGILVLYVFYEKGITEEYMVYRINDRFMILESEGYRIDYNKRN